MRRELFAMNPDIDARPFPAPIAATCVYSEHHACCKGRNVIETDVEIEYRKRIDAMSPAERMARSAAMFAWTRQQMARQIRSADPTLSDEQVKWRVALRLYEHDPEVIKLIEENLPHVSR